MFQKVSQSLPYKPTPLILTHAAIQRKVGRTAVFRTTQHISIIIHYLHCLHVQKVKQLLLSDVYGYM